VKWQRPGFRPALPTAPPSQDLPPPEPPTTPPGYQGAHRPAKPTEPPPSGIQPPSTPPGAGGDAPPASITAGDLRGAAEWLQSYEAEEAAALLQTVLDARDGV
jgi:hypothetical protein